VLICLALAKQKNKKPRLKRDGAFLNNFGGDLLSHTVAHAVSSAQQGLTSVFEMGTGVTPTLLPPKSVNSVSIT
jgi:hypothetical protein